MMHHTTITLLLTAVWAGVGIAAEFKPTRQVVFKNAKDFRKNSLVELKLHIFEPEGHSAGEKRAAIVFFFGGGWNGGTPKQFYQQATEMSKLGLVGISAEYRVRGSHRTTPFEAVEDAKSAIRYVREHAKELGVDPDKIIASGGSAGGHVAVCTAVIKGQECADENTAISSQPNAVIAYNPVLDTTKKGYGASRFKSEDQTTLSPCHQVTPDLVSIMVLHGTGDTTVPFENAERFVKRMLDAGNTAELVSYDGRGHGFFNAPFFRPKAGESGREDYRHTFNQSLRFLKSLGYLEKEAVLQLESE